MTGKEWREMAEGEWCTHNCTECQCTNCLSVNLSKKKKKHTICASPKQLHRLLKAHFFSVMQFVGLGNMHKNRYGSRKNCCWCDMFKI